MKSNSSEATEIYPSDLVTPVKDDRQPKDTQRKMTVSPESAFESYKWSTPIASSPVGVDELREPPHLKPEELFTDRCVPPGSPTTPNINSHLEQIINRTFSSEVKKSPKNLVIKIKHPLDEYVLNPKRESIARARDFVENGHSNLRQDNFVRAIESYQIALTMFSSLVGDLDHESIQARIYLG